LPAPARRSTVAALALLIALAACGADAEPAPGPDCPAEAASPPPERPYQQDPELAARIPVTVAGTELRIETVCATVFDPGGMPTSDAMLEQVGVERSDVSIALTPRSGDGISGGLVGVTAWRYGGAEEEDIRSAFLGLLDEAEIPVERDTVGGREIDRALFHVYYVAGDTLYSVLGEDDRVEEVIAALP
jgi:hypothetical protein